jgi:hypothetical protein
VLRTFERFHKASQLVQERRACGLEAPTGNRVISAFVRREMIEQTELTVCLFDVAQSSSNLIMSKRGVIK